MGLIQSLRDFLTPAARESVTFNGVTYPLPYPSFTLQGTREEIGSDFVGLGEGTLKGDPVVFACMQARASLFSEARFMYRQVRSGTPGELFSLPELEILRHPWPGGTTGDLLARVMQDADLAGNSLWVRRTRTRLARLRPDWAVLIHGSFVVPDMDMWDPDAEFLGVAYTPGGLGSGNDPVFFQASEVAHFAPIPDPLAPLRGMSWLTPLIREIQADTQMTVHKQAYLVNGATPNLVITGVPGGSPAAFAEWVDKFEAGHKGAANAYKSLYLTAAMDAKVLGSDMAQVDFKAVQGLGETRIAAAAGVPAAVVGISEGLAGSSLNAGNFQSAMRRFADLTMRPAWRNVCGSFERIIAVPGGAELWYDDRDISALKDDIKDHAQVQQLQAQAIRQYVDAGFEPASVVDAINAGDLTRLRHSGLYSVQLQLPTTTQPAPVATPPARDAGLFALLEAAERRADAAERRTDIVPQPVFNITTPPVQVDAPVSVTVPEQPVTVTIERGAVEVPVTVEAPITVEVPEPPAPTVVFDENAVQVREHRPMRTVIDRDPETGKVTGSHEEDEHDA